MLGEVAEQRARRLAFVMAQHERVGARSWVRGLELGVVRMVLEYL